jgi:hypothetical protein
MENGLKVTVAKDSDKRNRTSSFVLLVYDLQKHFPDRVDRDLSNLSTLIAAIDRVLKRSLRGRAHCVGLNRGG